MNQTSRLARAAILLLTIALLPISARAEMPALKISYSLATLAPSIGSEAPAGNLWERVRAGFKLPESDPRLTRVHEQAFAKNPAHLQRIVERSRYYLFHIVEEVDKRGMPMEIALLPIIESAFDPRAQSPMKASGIWQFIPSTGRVYGLEQNAWYDGRRDVLQATTAALDYLQYLHAMFGDWELALAAYNCGEGCVTRAQARARGKRYTSIQLPSETRNYVPKLVAVRNIIKNPERFGITLQDIADEAYFMQVTLNRPIEARHAATLAEMGLDEFLALNPAFHRRVIYTDARNVLLLPADRVETFQANLNRQDESKRLQTYAARRGESASSIASKFGVSIAWLKEHNPIKLYRGKVATPQTLVVPVVAKTAPAQPAKAAQAAAGKPSMRTHTVRKGDTLARLAKRYKVKVADIRRWNDNADPLMPGSKLDIPVLPG